MRPLIVPRRARRVRHAGFTLIEILVTLIVTVELLLAALALFDFSNKLSKAQIQIADMQQSLRIGQYEVVRMVRMAGRGELPIANVPANAFQAAAFAGTAVALRDNTPTNTGIVLGSGPTDDPTAMTNPRVLAGTDVLTVRGVFTTPLYQINAADPAAFTYDKNQGTGTLKICGISPTGVSQPVDSNGAPGSFQDAITNKRPESIILVSAVNDAVYGVAQLDFANSTFTAAPGNDPSCPNQAEVVAAFKTKNVTATALSSGGVYPDTLTNISFAGIVEEYRYYVREVHATPTDLTTELNPVLSRARVYAGTDQPWDGNASNLYEDIAEGIIDLQAALGFDLNGDQVVTESTANPGTDEWLFNGAADNATSAPWSPAPAVLPPMYYVRLNLLVRTNRHDAQYVGPTVVSIENHVYSSTPSNPWDPNGSSGLSQRRRYAQTVIGIRNRI